MKHIKEEVSNGSIIHFESGKNYSFCGTHIPIEKSQITIEKVTCGLCIPLIKKAQLIKQNEYVK